MNILLKFLSTLVIFYSLANHANAFDLKSLTDKIQKDIGNKLQVPKGGSNSGGNNPLGGLMKNLNNKGGSSISLGNMAQNSQGSSGNGKLAKGVCEPNIAGILKNLPKGDVASLSSDFNNASTDQISNIIRLSPESADRFVKTLNTYDGAFETKEVEELFSAFISKKSIDDLATLKALTGIKPGFNKNKKQIKADANFAYGLIHYYYHANGGNKQLGINLIKEAAGTPNNIGALSLYGAWQFFGTNVGQNTESGNANALEGYNRAFEKNRATNVSGPLYQMKKIKYPEKIFLEIAGNDRNPYKQQYQNQLAQASQMNKDVMKSLKNSEKYDKKSGWWPSIVKQQNLQHAIVYKIGKNVGLAEELKPLKAKYAVLKSKIAQAPTNAQIVQEMLIINQELINKVEKALISAESLDEEGKKQIKVLSKDNEILILRNQSLALSIMAGMLAQGGFGQGFFELTKMTEIIGGNRSIACRAYTSVKSYASRTKITLAEEVTNENAEADTDPDLEAD